MTQKTMYYIRGLIIFECFFCVNRSFIIHDRKMRFTCNFVATTMIVIILGGTVFDLFTNSLSVGIRIIQFLVGVELVNLVVGANYASTFDAIQRLDEKCSVSDHYVSQIKAMSLTTVFMSVISFTCDFVGLIVLVKNVNVAIYLAITFGAHDIEMGLLTILINAMSIRVSELGNSPPNIGSKVHRNVLIATSHLSEEFTLRILIMLLMVLITTIIYAFVLFFVEFDMINHLWLYLIWRETRSLYSLWSFSSAISRTDTLCRMLASQLTGRMALDQSISKEHNPAQYRVLERWCRTALTQRPIYVSSSFVSINASMPLQLIDLSINYMLIIVQMYIAYK